MSYVQAVNALRNMSLFRDVSVGLLNDLVERSQARTVSRDEDMDVLLLVVLEGQVEVTLPDRPLTVGHRVRAGETFLADQHSLLSRPVRLRPSADRAGRVQMFDGPSLRALMRASPSLARSMDRPDAGLVLSEDDSVAPLPRFQLLWLSRARGFDFGLEPYADLLAAGLAEQFGELAAVVVLDGSWVELRVWLDGDFVRVRRPVPANGDGPWIERLIDDVGFASHYGHLVIVHPDDPWRPPRRLRGLRVHRLVFLTPELPSVVPPEAPLELLYQDLLDPPRPPLCSSFVATVLLPAGRPSTGGFDTKPLETQAGEPQPVDRLTRDHCRLGLDPTDVAGRWSATAHASRSGFAARMLADPAVRRRVFRWGRAVTNRRVGIALSGGGAASYRIVPLLRHLEERGVPIDLVAGNSGGALLGAYYCRHGQPGLDLCIRRGTRFQAVMPFAAVTSRVVSWVMNLDLGGVAVDELETPLVALTTVLPPSGPPQAHVIVRGTLGDAVRASGAAPVVYGPMAAGDRRYADGSTAAWIPAQALWDRGADLVFACNSIPGPARRNPLEGCWLADVLYRRTIVGRFADLLTSGSFLLSRIAREVAEDAHVFVDAGAVPVPLVDSIFFCQADGIARAFERDDDFGSHVDKCVRRWEGFCQA